MNLLERYLQAVRFFIPLRQQDDIVRELSENLVSQMEDRQEELGRPLTEDEQADILRRHGHPMLVAGRYRSRQQLIGPVFFSLYLFTLKIGLAVALIVTVVLAVMTAVLQGDPVSHFVKMLLSFPGRALMVFGWTTLGFAALDIAQSRLKLTHNWDPRSLPKVVTHEHQISRAHSLCELLLSVACIVWLLLLPQAPVLVMGPAAAFLDLGPIWSVVYVPILLLMLATATLSLVNFVRPYWTVARSVTRLAIHGASFLVFAVLLRAGEWVVAKADAVLPAGVSLDHVVEIVNVSCQIGLFIACLVSLFEIVREVRRLMSRRKTIPASGSATARIAR
jgi:hypothetical protein